MNRADQDTAHYFYAADLMKVVGIVLMVLIHAELLMVRMVGFSHRMDRSIFWWDLYVFLGLYSLSLPFYAGLQLRESLQKYFVGHRLRNFDMRDLWILCLLLGCLESLKNALLFGLPHGFVWDVLHFAGLSLWILLFLFDRGGFRALAIFSVGIFFLSIFADLVRFFYFKTWPALPDIVIQICLAIILFLVPTALVWLQRKKRGSAIVVGLLAGVLAWQVFNRLSLDPLFLREIRALPLAILLSPDPANAHIWPLVPWILLPLAGFIFSHLRHLALWPVLRKIILFLGLPALVGLALWSVPEYLRALDATTYFSQHLFATGPLVVLSLCLWNALHLSALDWALGSAQAPIWVRELSKGILPLYFLHFFVAEWFAKAYILSLGAGLGFLTFPFFVLIVSGLLMLGLNALFETRLIFYWRKRA